MFLSLQPRRFLPLDEAINIVHDRNALLERGSVLLETVRFLVLFDKGDAVEVVRPALGVLKGRPLVGLLHRNLGGL